MASFRIVLAEPICLSKESCRHVAGQVAHEFGVAVGDLHALRDVDSLDAVVGPDVPPPAVPLAMLDLQPLAVPGAEAS